MTDLPIVLVIDDEVRSQEALRRVLGDDFHVLTAGGAAEAEALLEAEMVHVILCDQRMPGTPGVRFLKEVRQRWPDPVRMIISGHADTEDIIAGVNEAGIYRYISKPWEPDALLRTVRDAAQIFTLQRENESASLEIKLTADSLERVVARKKTALKRHHHFDRIVHAETSPLRDCAEMARRIARFDISVLLTGESGTGKELLARAIHYNSTRADGAFVIENCGALPDQLLESELFGCKKGAFTGAYEDRIGLFEQANGGTIFLDEIGETSPAFQVKLLRVLQEGEIRPLGARLTRKIDVRVIAATNRDLDHEVMAGRFRRDLFYRLAAFPIHLPPLRERPMDVPLLADMLVAEAVKAFGRPVRGFTDGAMALMRAYDWPGNVREMQNEIQRMMALADGEWLDSGLLSGRIRGQARPPEDEGFAGTLKDRVEMLEEGILREALGRHSWNISRVAQELGLSRVGLRGKLVRYGLERAG
ncbi:MAG: sigma-54-dependent Fis family transcriptional regulator [Alphaproteobacteria bacterium]|nr:sigma-54-dependent Fis family transcriptional regulator [Alphaproteobacteria bacterium]